MRKLSNIDYKKKTSYIINYKVIMYYVLSYPAVYKIVRIRIRPTKNNIKLMLTH